MENKKEDEIHDLLKQTIARKDIERQIADLFYKLCPHVPPQLLATTVMQTLDNFKSLENIYIGGSAERDTKDDVADALRYAVAVECSLNPELFKCSYQQSLIPTNENPTEIKKRIEEGMKRSFEIHIPRID